MYYLNRAHLFVSPPNNTLSPYLRGSTWWNPSFVKIHLSNVQLLHLNQHGHLYIIYTNIKINLCICHSFKHATFLLEKIYLGVNLIFNFTHYQKSVVGRLNFLLNYQLLVYQKGNSHAVWKIKFVMFALDTQVLTIRHRLLFVNYF